MKVQTIVKNGKPEYVVLPWDEYQAMLEALEDRADAAALTGFAERLARGEEETLPAAMVDRLLAGESPLRVWREHRGLTQSQLGEAAGVAQSMVAMIERGDRRGTVDTLAAIARVLKIELDDLTRNRQTSRGHVKQAEQTSRGHTSRGHTQARVTSCNATFLIANP